MSRPASWVIFLLISVCLLVAAGIPPSYIRKKKNRTIYVSVVTPCALIIYLVLFYVLLILPLKSMTRLLRRNPYAVEEREIEMRNMNSSGRQRVNTSNSVNDMSRPLPAGTPGGESHPLDRPTSNSNLSMANPNRNPNENNIIVAHSRSFPVAMKEIVQLEESVILLENARGMLENNILSIKREYT
ncbi:hypothetical protein ADEAN_000435300 [Angomonas deanei]|uniref:Uncharacterized protein n=1 Tax=Angomonas deanei TaxID=59799 RepID=A0A7G2CBP2_9TRYP|nr:hypothetical protein ADEAN_000435300 [Angomonas deanei]